MTIKLTVLIAVYYLCICTDQNKLSDWLTSHVIYESGLSGKFIHKPAFLPGESMMSTLAMIIVQNH